MRRRYPAEEPPGKADAANVGSALNDIVVYPDRATEVGDEPGDVQGRGDGVGYAASGSQASAVRAAAMSLMDGPPVVPSASRPGIPKRATIHAGPMYFSWPGRACFTITVWLPIGLASEYESKMYTSGPAK